MAAESELAPAEETTVAERREPVAVFEPAPVEPVVEPELVALLEPEVPQVEVVPQLEPEPVAVVEPVASSSPSPRSSRSPSRSLRMSTLRSPQRPSRTPVRP